MTTRRFFYQETENQEFLWQQASLMPCCGRLPSGSSDPEFFISIRPDETVLIFLSPAGWKLTQDTWYRKDIPTGIESVLRERFARDPEKPTWLVWSKEEEFFPEDHTKIRVVTKEEMNDEPSVLWQWIVHICSQTRTVQRTGVPEGFEEWLGRLDSLTIPTPILENLRP